MRLTDAEAVALAACLHADRVRLTDTDGNESGLINPRNLVAGKLELIGLVEGAREAWIKLADGTSVTLRVHGRPLEAP
ncbi:MAG: hypothetical protein OXH38_11790 [Chloroflexi bacterium]|nr:hypothetical protein [Chloroflexota bacterium]